MEKREYPLYKAGRDSVLLVREPLIIFTIVNTFLMLIAIGVYLGIFYGYLKKDWVDKKNCVAPVGEFAVEPGTNVDGALTLCPDSKQSNNQCIYNVPSLLDATRVCNQKGDICSKFVYNDVSNQMKIVSLQARPTEGSRDDNVYTRQANVTFRSGTINRVTEPPEQPIPVAPDGTVDPTAITTTTSNLAPTIS